MLLHCFNQDTKFEGKNCTLSLFVFFVFGVCVFSTLKNLFLPTICSSGTDVGDHPPITPMRSATRDQLRDAEWKIYDFVTRHFLATVSLISIFPYQM